MGRGEGDSCSGQCVRGNEGEGGGEGWRETVAVGSV